MLKAKDEMVRELERQIKEMKADSEASLKAESDDDDKAKSMTAKDDSEKLAHTPEHDEKKEHYNKMSESNLSPVMLSEIQALNEKLSAQDAEIKKLRSERDSAECDRAVDVLLREGKISPSENDVARKAWELREMQPEFWQMFSAREQGASVPLAEIGHGASGAEISQATLHQEISKLSQEKGILYSEALAEFRADNPDYYLKAFGG